VLTWDHPRDFETHVELVLAEMERAVEEASRT
jgi:hypothetical protein